MSRYETYKPSGIDWIGEVPEHFKLRRFKNEFLYLKGKNPKETFFLEEANGRTTDMPYLSMEYLRNENAEPEFPEKDERLVSVEDGESLLLWDGSNAGEFIKSKKGYLSSTMVRIDHSKRMNSKYAFYIFQSYERILRDFTNGMGIPHVNGVLLNNSYLPITHNEAEQLAIANYLDDQTQKIDRLIANKKAQAEKLKELRQIEINNAVTKGLNPNAEMKDSGIEWLGKIPKHWEMKRLKNILLNINSGDGISNDELVEDGEIEVYGGNGVMGYTDKYNSEGNVIIIGRVGAKCGVVYLVDKKIWISDNALQSRTYQDYEFVFFLIDAMNLNNYANQNAQPLITGGILKGLYAALPPKQEQTEIASYLQQRTTAIDHLIKNIEAQIEKLQELRKIKIYEAVTGKIKVNAYA